MWKFPIPISDEFVIKMPLGAEPLFVATQYGEPQMWAQVNTEAPVVEHRFRLAGTGHRLPDEPMDHVGSFLIAGDDLVFHVFKIHEGPF